MYEVPIPSTGVVYKVRGMTLQEELEIRSWVSLLAGTAYDLYSRITTLLWKTVVEPKFATLDEFADSIQEGDVASLMFALYYESFGEEMRIEYTCGNETRTATVKLDAVESEGSVCEQPIENEGTFEWAGATYHYHPTPTWRDALSALAAAPVTIESLMNPQQLMKLPEEDAELMMAANKLNPIYKKVVAGRSVERPPVTQPTLQRNWYRQLLRELGGIDRREFDKLLVQRPPQHVVKLYVNIPCKVCNSTHRIELEPTYFLRCFLGV